MRTVWQSRAHAVWRALSSFCALWQEIWETYGQGTDDKWPYMSCKKLWTLS